MKKLIGKRLAAAGLAVALVVSAVSVPNQASAAKAVKKVKVNKKKVTLYPKAEAGYGSIKIKASVTPKGAKAKFKWKSNKKKVATVNSKGLIKAKKPGKAVITVKAGKKSAKVKVTVKKIKKKVTKVTVASNKLTVAKGKTATIKASVAPAKATLKAVTYTSSNKAVATVTAKGVVKGIKAGTATITVKAVDGSKKKATVTVTVTDAAVTPSKNPTPATTAPAVPSAVPSTEPSAVPSTEPSAKPSADPTESPEPEIVAPDPDIPGNLKYTLDAATAEDEGYLAEATVQGEDYSVLINDVTFDLAQKALAKLANGLDYEKYTAKSINESYEPAEDVTVTVTKEAGNTGAVVKLNGIGDQIDGDYWLDIACWYAGPSEALYNVTFTNWDAAGNEVNKIDLIGRDYVKASDGTKAYKIEGLTVKLGGAVKVCSDINNHNDDIDVTVSYNESSKAGEVTIVKGTEKIKFTTDGENGYTVSVPEAYVEKYAFDIF